MMVAMKSKVAEVMWKTIMNTRSTNIFPVRGGQAVAFKAPERDELKRERESNSNWSVTKQNENKTSNSSWGLRKWKMCLPIFPCLETPTAPSLG